ITKHLIHTVVCLPMVWIVSDVLGKIVESRPKRLIAESLVEFLNILLRKKYRHHLVLVQFQKDFCSLFRLIDHISRPAYPDILTFLVYRAETGGKASCGRFEIIATVS